LGFIKGMSTFTKNHLMRTDQSLRDDLTGLHNMRFVREAVSGLIENARRKKEKLCICFADLDDLKIINDVYSHQAGDKALVKFSQVLKDSIRASDLLARYGGDEFIIVFTAVDEKSATSLIERMQQDMLEMYVEFDKHNIKLIASSGFVIGSPDDKNVFEKLLLEADAEMYRQKNERKEKK
jgi:diguanylate cyclase (GGDEF)-like protein